MLPKRAVAPAVRARSKLEFRVSGFWFLVSAPTSTRYPKSSRSTEIHELSLDVRPACVYVGPLSGNVQSEGGCYAAESHMDRGRSRVARGAGSRSSSASGGRIS